MEERVELFCDISVIVKRVQESIAEWSTGLNGTRSKPVPIVPNTESHSFR